MNCDVVLMASSTSSSASLSTMDFAQALRSYSPQLTSLSRSMSFAQVRASTAQRRRSYISLIVSREREKRAHAQGLACFSLDTVALSSPSRKPKFVFSHSTGHNFEKDASQREPPRSRDDASHSLPPAQPQKNNSYSSAPTGFRPMNARTNNNFLSGQQIGGQPRTHNSSNTSSSHSEFLFLILFPKTSNTYVHII